MASPGMKLDLRITALREAVETFSDTDLTDASSTDAPESQTTAILRRADRFYGWLMGTTRSVLRIGPVVGEASDIRQPQHSATEGEIVQLNTGQKFSIALDTRDASGYATDATVEWSISDPSIATLVLDESDDQKGWVISGAPGSTVLSATIVDADPALPPATLAIDVVPAGTATVVITTGPPVPETDPQPLPLTLTAVEDSTDLNRLTVSFTADNKGEGAVTITPGDGNPGIPNPGDGTTVSPYVYATAGTYTASVVDDDNASRLASLDVTVPFTA